MSGALQKISKMARGLTSRRKTPALQMTDSIPRFVASKAVGKFRHDVYWGPFGCLRYRDVKVPDLPDSDWVRVRTIYGGICGSDIGTITLKTSTATTVFTSFPFTLGHENVGMISEVGNSDWSDLLGRRVVVDPLLSYPVRDLPQPPGRALNHCLEWDRGEIAPGMLTGFCRDTGGAWSEEFVAHRSQLVAVPDHLSDEEAVLAEPFAVALHAVLRAMPSDDDTVLVIGGGVIGLCVIAAIRALGCQAQIVAIARYDFQAEEARRLGANVILGRARGEQLERELVEALDARTLKPVIGPDVVVGGADVVFDCVGSTSSVDQAMRFATSGGRVVMVGLTSELNGIDWTPLWLNELSIFGTYCYAIEEWQGERISTMALAVRLMAEGKADLAPLVTHRFKLAGYREALETVTSKGSSGVIKGVFDFRDRAG